MCVEVIWCYKAIGACVIVWRHCNGRVSATCYNMDLTTATWPSEESSAPTRNKPGRRGFSGYTFSTNAGYYTPHNSSVSSQLASREDKVANLSPAVEAEQRVISGSEPQETITAEAVATEAAVVERSKKLTPQPLLATETIYEQIEPAPRTSDSNPSAPKRRKNLLVRKR